jgi:hypothetical protein
MNLQEIQAELKTLKAERTALKTRQTAIAPLWQEVGAELYDQNRKDCQAQIDALNVKIHALYELL